MRDEVITFRRTELYDNVWREPLRTLARRCGVSDVGLRKICIKLRVPLPERGHWVRLRRGRKDRRPPLPLLPDGVPAEIVTRRKEPRPEVAQVGPPITVPAELRNPHKLVSEASRLLRSRE